MKLNERLKIAGRELGKANFGTAAKSLFSQSLTPSTYRGGSNSGFWWISEDGRCDMHFDYTGINSSLTAYTSCPPVTAIINRKAQAFINGKTWILNEKGKGKGKEATGEVATRLRNLLKRPNPLQSGKQFEAQHYIYQQIAGYVVVMPLGKPVGFDASYAKSLWNIPPWMLEINEKVNVSFLSIKEPKDLIASIYLVYNGTRTQLPLDDIYIFKDFTPSAGSVVIPESRICSLKQPINNIIGAYESRGVLIEKRGPSMIISSSKSDESGNISLTTMEKEELENQFMTRYGLMRKQARAIITSAPVKLDTVGFSTKELMLFEEIEDDIMRICDGYVFPYPLMASSRTNNLGGGLTDPNMRVLYQNAIMPEAESIFEQWMQFLKLEQYALILDKDFSHIASMQEDKEKEAGARLKRNQALLIEFQNNLLTLDEWREKNGEDPVIGEHGKKYYFQLKAEGIEFMKAGGTNVADTTNPDAAGNSGSDQGQTQNQ